MHLDHNWITDLVITNKRKSLIVLVKMAKKFITEYDYLRYLLGNEKVFENFVLDGSLNTTDLSQFWINHDKTNVSHKAVWNGLIIPQNQRTLYLTEAKSNKGNDSKIISSIGTVFRFKQ